MIEWVILASQNFQAPSSCIPDKDTLWIGSHFETVTFFKKAEKSE